jgi:hypothetical protein
MPTSRLERSENRQRFADTRTPEYDPQVERRKNQLGFTLKRVLHVDQLDRTQRKECWHFFTITPEHNHQQWNGVHYKTFTEAMEPLNKFSHVIKAMR